jgi:methyltransferase (TIGR00027 family)
MRETGPSRTAYRVALRRASHQILDDPKVLSDPCAIPILGAQAAAELRANPRKFQDLASRNIRAFVVARSRFAEDELARAVERGAVQYVILGAGLDTFAYRNPFPETALRVFEVDYPATQEWKRRQLLEAEIPIPASVTFVPLDFERETLRDCLLNSGFDAHKPTFFSWLGVTMYLTEDAVMATLEFIASTAQGGGVVFDYSVPRSSLGLIGRLAFDALSHRVAAAGEPFRTFFDPRVLAARMSRMGFRSVESLNAEEINSRYFHDRADGLHVGGKLAQLMSAEI